VTHGQTALNLHCESPGWNEVRLGFASLL